MRIEMQKLEKRNTYTPLGASQVKVNPMNTTKECSACGNKQDMPLHKRQYEDELWNMALLRKINVSL